MVYGGAAGRAVRRAGAHPGRAHPRRGGHVGRVDLGGGRRLDSHYSPGHAKHHVGLIDSVSGDLYVGDAAGVYIQETGDMRPATPPPDFDLGPRWHHCVRLHRCGRSGCCSATSGRSARSARPWSGPPRRSACGWSETRRAVGSGLSLDHAAAMVTERPASGTRPPPGARPGAGRQVRALERHRPQRGRHHALAREAGASRAADGARLPLTGVLRWAGLLGRARLVLRPGRSFRPRPGRHLRLVGGRGGPGGAVVAGGR